MQTRVYKLSHASAASLNAAAQLIIQQNGVITGILFQLAALAGAGNGFLVNEISFTPASQLTTNDPVGPLASAALGLNTNGGESENCMVNNIAIPIRSGDRLFCNQALAGTAPGTVVVNVYIYVSF